MTLNEVLKNTNYDVSLFSEEARKYVEDAIVVKTIRGKESLFIKCLKRDKEIALKPEEAVRQLYLYKLIHEYGYPTSRIEVEFPIHFGREVKRADIAIMDKIKDLKVIVLLNKTDLDPVVDADEIHKYLSQDILPFSAKNGQGLDYLEKMITDMFFTGQIMDSNEVFLTNARHIAALSDANESLKHVVESISMDMPEDFLSIDLMDAYESLGIIIGESVEEDLVNEIFAKFCTGK